MNSNSRIPNTENKLNGQQLYSPVYYLGFRKFVIILKIVIVSYLQSFLIILKLSFIFLVVKIYKQWNVWSIWMAYNDTLQRMEWWWNQSKALHQNGQTTECQKDWVINTCRSDGGSEI